MRGGGDYVIKRVLFALVTVFVAITLNFVIFRAAPGDATTAMRCLGCTPQVREQVRHELGLDTSKWHQYVLYLEHLAQGDLGRSFQNRQPVFGQLWSPLLNTLPMILLGTVFAILLRHPDGGGRRLAARYRCRHRERLDRARVLLAAHAVARADADPVSRRPARPADVGHLGSVSRLPARRAGGPSSPTG